MKNVLVLGNYIKFMKSLRMNKIASSELQDSYPGLNIHTMPILDKYDQIIIYGRHDNLVKVAEEWYPDTHIRIIK